jgi:predicted O-methyltransferase YrrM
MFEIERCLPEGGDWCGLEKAHSLAALVIGLRPRVICEIGVWMGGSLIPMALALRALRDIDRGAGRDPVGRVVVAIDPWAAQESIAGQDPDNVSWWGSVDHEAAMRAFLARLDQHELRDLCRVERASSSLAPVPPAIDLLHVDGNHADQARMDVERFAPSVVPGGILVLDDLSWSGDHVRMARDIADSLGFRELHALGTGIVMQRIR